MDTAFGRKAVDVNDGGNPYIHKESIDALVSPETPVVEFQVRKICVDNPVYTISAGDFISAKPKSE